MRPTRRSLPNALAFAFSLICPLVVSVLFVCLLLLNCFVKPCKPARLCVLRAASAHRVCDPLPASVLIFYWASLT